jgi:hypothetical protein
MANADLIAPPKWRNREPEALLHRWPHPSTPSCLHTALLEHLGVVAVPPHVCSGELQSQVSNLIMRGLLYTSLGSCDG